MNSHFFFSKIKKINKLFFFSEKKMIYNNNNNKFYLFYLLLLLFSISIINVESRITNFVSCVEEHTENKCTVHFGYLNPSQTLIEVSVNTLSGDEWTGGPITTQFEPGLHKNAFQVEMDCNNELTWTIESEGATMIAIADNTCAQVCPKDCLNVTFGSTVMDECEVCGGDQYAPSCPRCGIELIGTICDFTCGHPDFALNMPLLEDRGIVLERLLADQTPDYAGAAGNPTTHGQQYFDDWFHEHSTINVCTDIKLYLQTEFPENFLLSEQVQKRSGNYQNHESDDDDDDDDSSNQRPCSQASDCNDFNNCTTDSCVNRRCQNKPVNCGCDDLCASSQCNPVTGKCVKNPKDCDDGNPCTLDACDAYDGGCVHQRIEGCVPPCTSDSCCNDNNPCTENKCINGACVSTLKRCDDYNPCTDDFCNRETGNCVYNRVIIDDGNNCTIDACAQGTGLITHTLKNCFSSNPCLIGSCALNGTCITKPKTCDNANPCTVGKCNAVDGSCYQEPINCNDHNPCTEDSCVNGQCVNTLICCNDGKHCTIDTCHEGECIHTPKICLNLDNDICTSETCDEASGGQCVTTDIVGCGGNCAHDSDCSNTGSRCQVGVCNAATHKCTFVPRVCPSDSNPCTMDICNEEFGCHNVHKNCTSEDWCRIGACNPNDGMCTLVPRVCENNNPCEITYCDSELKQCISKPKECPCADSCFVAECSIEQGGLCVQTPLDCNDHNPCTKDSCFDGGCVNEEICCNDGRKCTIDSCNVDTGRCDHDPVVCHPKDKCTFMYCSEEDGECHERPIVCKDDRNCTRDVCDLESGICIFENILYDDGNVCTIDSCDEANGGAPIYERIPGCAEVVYCPCDPDFDNVLTGHLEKWAFMFPGFDHFSLLDFPTLPKWTEHVNGSITFSAHIGSATKQFDVFLVFGGIVRFGDSNYPASDPSGGTWIYYTTHEFGALYGTPLTITENAYIELILKPGSFVSVGIGANGNDYQFGAAALQLEWQVITPSLCCINIPQHGCGSFNVDLNVCPPLDWSPISYGCSFSMNETYFYPIDHLLLGNSGQQHNGKFTLQLHLGFIYEAHQHIHFTHSDDLFVYIDGRLVLDGGGLYLSQNSSLYLDQVRPVLVVNQFYRLDIFFAHRQDSPSVFQIHTNVPIHNGICQDECGIPNGDNSACKGCDGVANSELTYDVCGVCGGDGTSCDFVDCEHANVTIQSHSGCSIRSFNSHNLMTEFCYEINDPNSNEEITLEIDFEHYEQCTIREQGTCSSLPSDHISNWCDLFQIERIDPAGKWSIQRVGTMLRYCANFTLFDLLECESPSGARLITRRDGHTEGSSIYSGTMFATIIEPQHCDNERACDIPVNEECCPFEIELSAHGTSSSEIVHQNSDIQVEFLHTRFVSYDAIITLETCINLISNGITYLANGTISRDGESGYPLDVTMVSDCLPSSPEGRCCQVWTLRTNGADRDSVLTGRKMLKFNVYTHNRNRMPGWVWLNVFIERQDHVQHLSQSLSSELDIYRDRYFLDKYYCEESFIDCESVYAVLSLDLDDSWYNDFRVIAREIRLCFSDDPEHFPLIPYNSAFASSTGCNSPGGAAIKEIDLYIRETSFYNRQLGFMFLVDPPSETSRIGFSFKATPLSSSDIAIEVDWYAVVLSEEGALQDITYTYNGEPFVHEGTHSHHFEVECKPWHFWSEESRECERNEEDQLSFQYRSQIVFCSLLLLVILFIGILCMCAHRKKDKREKKHSKRSAHASSSAAAVVIRSRKRNNNNHHQEPLPTHSSRKNKHRSIFATKSDSQSDYVYDYDQNQNQNPLVFTEF